MQSILVLGAGLSASSLIKYLLDNASSHNWTVTITDKDIDLVKRKIGNNPAGIAMNFNALDQASRLPEIKKADLVISMLPATFHPEIATDCLAEGKHLITPSYVSPQMQALNDQVRAKGLIFMNEIGVDPGIDHMSAMKIIDKLRMEGAQIESFKSYCGGLIAPESDNNPWNYKFTWNPRNVVLAGQGGAAQFVEKGSYKYIPTSAIFERTEAVNFPGIGIYEGYANRDSLSYRSVYGLEDIPTLFRATLRANGFCEAWNCFVQLGIIDESFKMADSELLTPRSFLNSFLPYHEQFSVEEKFKNRFPYLSQKQFDKFTWLGIFDDSKPFGLKNQSPAELLQHLLIGKWILEPTDKDMILMQHVFEYKINGKKQKLESSMCNIGVDSTYTAMSNTVGLPMGICAKMILNNQISERGVLLPISAEIYEPILEELKTFGIDFVEVIS